MSTTTEGVFTSSLADVEIPAIPVTDFVFGRVDERKIGNQVAFVDENDTLSITYDELRQNIKSFGSYLSRQDFKKGDAMLIFASNHVYYPIAFHGVASIGGVVSPANFAYSSRELMHQLNDSQSIYITTQADKLKEVQGAIAECKNTIKGVFVLDTIPEDMENFPVPLISFTTIFEDDGSAFPSTVDINVEEDVVCLPYSSGTTGLSKGVMLTHSNIVSNMCQFGNPEIMKFKSDDVIVGLLPFYHIYGMALLMNGGIREGTKVVVMSKFDPVKFLTLIQKHKISWLHIVPPIVLFLSAHPIVEKFDLSSVHTVVCGAAPLGEPQAAACAKRLNCSVRQGYGMTEMSPVSHISPADNKYHGSGGILISNTTAKIMNEEGNPCKVNEHGELWIKGPQNMKGYLNNEEATNHTVDSEGYLHTGDIGYVNEDGYYFIIDRLKELIKYKGFQVAPAELEALLLQHENIVDCCVIGKPDETAGEIPMAFVVMKEGSNLTEDDVKQYVVDQGIAHYKQLRGGVEFVASIPKSASGKILRRLLRDQSTK